MGTDTNSDLRCPVCGRGVVTGITYDQEAEQPEQIAQQPDARQAVDYSCGHRVLGPPLRDADERLDVERRDSTEPAAPLPEKEDPEVDIEGSD
jgi:hypothetical protein